MGLLLLGVLSLKAQLPALSINAAQSTPLDTFNSNVVWIDSTNGLNRFRVVKFDSIKVKAYQTRWITDSLNNRFSSYAPSITSMMITAALGFTPLNANGTSGQYIKGDGSFATFPTIPSAQVNSDWNSGSGVSQILNKPTIPTNTNQLTNGSGFITQTQGDGRYIKMTDTFPGMIMTTTQANSTGAALQSDINTKAPMSRTLTINGTTQDLTGNRTWSLTTSSVPEGSNQYYTDTRARASVSLTTTGTSGTATYNNSTGVLNIPNYSSSTGTVTSVGITSTDFSISGSPVTTSGNITANLNTTGVSAGTYDRVTVDTKGRVTAGTSQAVPTAIASGGRNFNQAYQISTTQWSRISISAAAQVQIVILGNATGTVTLEISPNGSTGWVYIGQLTNASSLIGISTTNGSQLVAEVPPGYYWRATTNSSTSGLGNTATFTFQGGSQYTY